MDSLAENKPKSSNEVVVIGCFWDGDDAEPPEDLLAAEVMMEDIEPTKTIIFLK